MLVKMSNDLNMGYAEHNVPNSWMASAPKHPVWMWLLKRVNDSNIQGVESVAGSVFMHENIFKFPSNLTTPSITFVQPGTDNSITQVSCYHLIGA